MTTNKYKLMKSSVFIRLLAALLISCLLRHCCIAQLASPTNSLSDALLDVTEHRLKTYGPDFEIAQFLSVEREGAWERRETIFDLSSRHLDDTNATKVASAINVLGRLRDARLHDGPVGNQNPEEVKFVAKLDSVILAHFSHFKSLHNDDLYGFLSQYLGTVESVESSRQLKEIAKTAKNNEQALICLAWHRNPADMDFLLPFMLADSPTARSLPYHFRNSYGKAAVPYLRRTISEAKSATTRLEAAFELVHLRVPAGFQYLQDMAMQNSRPEGKAATQLERIRSFATDYLGLPHDAVKEEVVAAFIAKRQMELKNVEQ
jgi:hypothetical protein